MDRVKNQSLCKQIEVLLKTSFDSINREMTKVNEKGHVRGEPLHFLCISSKFPGLSRVVSEVAVEGGRGSSPVRGPPAPPAGAGIAEA